MKLIFHGTRGYIEARSDQHRMHSVCEVSYRQDRVTIDCGEDWRGRLNSLEPDCILLTHGHPDHARGLEDGAPCPVFATEETWELLDRYPIEDRHVVQPRKSVRLGRHGSITAEAFAVEHSSRAPTVAYRLSAGVAAVLYAPDLVFIYEREEAFAGVDLYVGDGASLERSLVRKIEGKLIGHTPVRTQLTWCQKLGVPRMIVTHCGSRIVKGNPQEIREGLQHMARERGVAAEIAYDGMETVLR